MRYFYTRNMGRLWIRGALKTMVFLLTRIRDYSQYTVEMDFEDYRVRFSFGKFERSETDV
jgi:hypothetical protein